MFMLDYRSIAWWYWLFSACLLGAGAAGRPWGFLSAIGLTVFQLIHFALRERRLTAFTLQVRFCYLMLLLAALPVAMHWLVGPLIIGTWARVIFGYCFMARAVSLLPWNRMQALSPALIRQTFLSAPMHGNILHGLPSVDRTGPTATLVQETECP